jgi:hypothetical protein
VRLRSEIDELWPLLHRTKIGSPRSIMLSEQLLEKTTEICGLMEYLHLAPAQQREPPPRLQ